MTTNLVTLTDAVIRNATIPAGKTQHYLHDKLPGLALRMRASGPGLPRGPMAAADAGAEISDCAPAGLLKRMLSYGISPFYPDPIAALAMAQRRDETADSLGDSQLQLHTCSAAPLPITFYSNPSFRHRLGSVGERIASR